MVVGGVVVVDDMVVDDMVVGAVVVVLGAVVVGAVVVLVVLWDEEHPLSTTTAAIAANAPVLAALVHPRMLFTRTPCALLWSVPMPDDARSQQTLDMGMLPRNSPVLEAAHQRLEQELPLALLRSSLRRFELRLPSGASMRSGASGSGLSSFTTLRR